MATIYRRDIDGLRCVAVLSVLCFHYGIGHLRGGYVGVDIFFVISGFLITSQILKEIEVGKFSLSNFYDRRIRRIAPALLTVLVSTLIAAYFILPPQDYSRLGSSAIASSIGISNIYFYQHSGYFDAAHELIPLLHTWSLGVEEQFYLFWPLLLGLLMRGSKVITGIALISLSVVSFLFSRHIVGHDQPQAFYMIYSRAWELAVGGLIAFVPAIASRVGAELLSVLGASLIVYSVTHLNAASVFPGTNAIAPCLGAALLVLPKQGATFVSRLLSVSAVVFIGRISYSLYLWHWPLLVLYKFHEFGTNPSRGILLALIAASFALATLSYYFIEQPIRKSRPRRSVTFVGACVATAAIIGMSSRIAISEGFPGRFSTASLHFFSYKPPPMVSKEYSPCFLTSHSEISDFSVANCVSISATKPNVLIIGDSHAAHFAEALRKVFPNISFSQVTASGCLPVLPLKGAKRCTTLMKRVFDEFIPHFGFSDVVISAYWRLSTAPILKSTVANLASRTRHVTVLGPSVVYNVPLPTLLGEASEDNDDTIVSRSANTPEALQISKSLQKTLADTGVQFLSVMNVLCPNSECKTTTANGTPMQFDDNHFTFEGAVEVVESLKAEGLFDWVPLSRTSQAAN